VNLEFQAAQAVVVVPREFLFAVVAISVRLEADIEALKYVREVTDADIRQTKDLVDAISRGRYFEGADGDYRVLI
jgi:ribosomal protein L7/L12